MESKRKYIILIAILFFGIKIYGQDECYKVFRNESVKEFKKMNYQKAIDNLKVAGSCEDKPKKNDVYSLIEKYQNCINYQLQADKLISENKYEIALYFYEQLAALNPEDSYAKNKIVECKEKLSCFPKTRDQGNNALRESKYSEAMQYFDQAQKCDVKPTYNDLLLLTDNIKQCLFFRDKADSLLAAKNYKSAVDNYINVLTLNPYDSYCKEQMKNIPSEFQQFIEKPINKGWFFTINFSSRNTAPFYSNKTFKTGDGFIGISGGRMKSWGYYGNLMIGSSSLWSFKNVKSSKYLGETGDQIAYVFKDGDYTASVEDQLYLIDSELLIHEYPDYTMHTNVSFSAGLTKRILNKKKLKIHLTAGLGLANWGAEQERYRESGRKLVIPDEPRLFHVLNSSGNGYETIELTEYWVAIPDNSYFYNFKNALAWEAGLIFNYNRFTLNLNTSVMLEGKDKEYIDTYNQMITIGLGYSW